MKKFKTLLLGLAGMAFAAPNASAQNMIGRVLAPEELENGTEVVFEARSGTDSKGHYLIPWVDASGTRNPCRALGSILDVTDDMVWVLEKSGKPNEVTGLDQWFIKNKKTGKYITFEWNASSGTQEEKDKDPDRWIDKWTNGRCGSVAPDTAHAKRFCIVSNNDEQWRGDYGSAGYGSSQSDWGFDTYTIVNIFDKTGCKNNQNDGCGYGRVYLCNEFPVSNFNITWYSQYQDTNVWDIRRVVDRGEDARTALEDLLDNFKQNIDMEYKAGTDPGFVSQDTYDDFYGKYSDALVAVSDESKTDEQLKTMFDDLLAAKDKADKDLVQIEDGGYYYIKPAYTAFTDVENGNFAWCAPYDGKYAGWRALSENDNSFIWQFGFMPDDSSDDTSGRMYYSMRNVGANVYLNRAESHEDSKKVLYSSEPERMFASNLDHAGQFNVGSKYDYYDVYPPRPYHQEGHQGGAGTKGYLVLWDGGVGSGSAWYIHKVPQEVIDHIADRAHADSLRLTVAKYTGITNGAQVGDLIGMIHAQQTIDDVDSALSKANKLLLQDPLPSNDELDAARADLIAKAEAFNNEINVVPDGYYRFHGCYELYAKNESGIYIGLYNDTLPAWKTPADKKNPEFVWKVTRLKNGHYTIQNLQNGKYLNKAEKPQNGSIVDLTAEPTTDQLLTPIAGNGQWGIHNTEDDTWGYDPNDHRSGQNSMGRIHIWSPRQTNGGTAWWLEKVSDEEVKDLTDNKAQYMLNAALRTKFQEGRRAYNAKTTYDVGDAIVTSKDQIYANNWSPTEGSDLGVLIDDDANTYWNSTWEGGKEQDPEHVHYLRIYDEAGFPDSVQVKYLMRQSGSWHRVPARMRVEVSNDPDAGWTALPDEFSLEDFGGVAKLSNLLTDYQTYVVSGIGGYKYVRFSTLSSINQDGGTYYANGHAVYGYAEYNLYPITGVNEASYTKSSSHKAVSDELALVVDQANKELVAGKATQATYDKLTAAIAAFNNLSSNDSLLVMAKYNVDNLSSDAEVIGNFPSASLDEYKTKAGSLIEKLDAPENLTFDEIVAAYKELRAAYDALYETMYKPEDNKWYVISTANADYNGYAIHADGMHTHAYNQTYSYILAKGYNVDPDTYDETYFSWTLNKQENGTYVPQNVGTGGYFGPNTGSGNGTYDYRPILWYKSREFTLVPVGNGQVAFQSNDGYYVQNKAAWLDAGLAYVKPDLDVPALANSGFAFTIEATEDEHPDMVFPYYTCCNGRVLAVTMPFENANPATYGSEELPAYELIGKVEADDHLVTAYKLKKIGDETIKAGRPVIYIMPGEYDESISESVMFTPVYNTPVSAVRDTVNGLVSVPASWLTSEAHLGYFLADSVVDEPISTLIGAQRAVIVPYLVKNISDEEPDAIVYVKGAGMLNGINKNQIVGIKMFVNVYTTDGVLVRKHVDAAKATEGLKKGVYVVGNKKVLVK